MVTKLWHLQVGIPIENSLCLYLYNQLWIPQSSIIESQWIHLSSRCWNENNFFLLDFMESSDWNREMWTFIAPVLSSSTPTASKFSLLELGALPAATKKHLRDIEFQKASKNSMDLHNAFYPQPPKHKPWYIIRYFHVKLKCDIPVLCYASM